MDLPRLIQQGVCEDPHFSMEYNVAELEFHRGLRELAASNPKNYLDDPNFNCSVRHFARSVGFLRDLYALGREVESIAVLPNEEDVKFLSRRKMIKLADDLGQLYFRS